MPLTDLQSVADKIQVLSAVLPGLDELSTSIAFIIASHTDDWTVALTPEDRTELLKALTGFVVALNVNIACYPLGYTDTALFDEDGNPL